MLLWQRIKYLLFMQDPFFCFFIPSVMADMQLVIEQDQMRISYWYCAKSWFSNSNCWTAVTPHLTIPPSSTSLPHILFFLRHLLLFLLPLFLRHLLLFLLLLPLHILFRPPALSSTPTPPTRTPLPTPLPPPTSTPSSYTYKFPPPLIDPTPTSFSSIYLLLFLLLPLLFFFLLHLLIFLLLLFLLTDTFLKKMHVYQLCLGK